MELIWGDDTVALDAAAASEIPTDTVDAAELDVSEILAKAGGALFGPRRLLIRGAAQFPPNAVAQLATGRSPVVLRCDGNAPAKLRAAVRDAGGAVTEHRKARDVASFARRYASQLEISISRDAVKALVHICGNDTALASSILRSCVVAGISNVTVRHIEALGGNATTLHAAEVAAAVKRGDVAAAFGALEVCRSDPHAVIATLRRSLAPMAGIEIAQVLADTEQRLRSPGRDAALWVCIERCSTLIGAATR